MNAFCQKLGNLAIKTSFIHKLGFGIVLPPIPYGTDPHVHKQRQADFQWFRGLKWQQGWLMAMLGAAVEAVCQPQARVLPRLDLAWELHTALHQEGTDRCSWWFKRGRYSQFIGSWVGEQVEEKYQNLNIDLLQGQMLGFGQLHLQESSWFLQN